MKISSLFAELGFKIEGKEDLKAFETSMVNIANAARSAALALKILARTPVPKGLRAMLAAPGAAAAPGGGGTPGTAVAPPAYVGPVPPKLGAPPLPTSALQGLKNLGALGLKVIGFATLAVTIKKLINALSDMIKKIMAATFGVDKFTFQTGISRRELKQWERVAALSDVSTEELHDTLKQLQQRAKSIEFGEGMSGFYGLLGVSAHNKPTDFLKQFAEATKNWEAARAVYVGAQVGVSENMVYLLRNNLDKLDDLMEGAELSDKEHDSVMKLNRAWAELRVTLDALWGKITSDLSPALKGIIDQLTLWSKVLVQSKERSSLIFGASLAPMISTPILLSSMMAGRGNTTVNQKVGVTINGATGTPEENAAAIKAEIDNAYYGHTDPRYSY